METELAAGSHRLTGISPSAYEAARPQHAQHAFAPHGALGQAGAARCVEDHRQPLVVVAVEAGRYRQRASARDDINEELDAD